MTLKDGSKGLMYSLMDSYGLHLYLWQNIKLRPSIH